MIMNSQERKNFQLWIDNLECWIVNSSGIVVKVQDLLSAITESMESYYALRCGGAWFIEYGNVRDLVLRAVYGKEFQDIDVVSVLYGEHDYAYMEIFPATKRLYDYFMLNKDEVPSYTFVNGYADIDGVVPRQDEDQSFLPKEGVLITRIDDEQLSCVMTKISETLKTKSMSASESLRVIGDLNNILIGIKEDVAPMSELRKKGEGLMSWVFVQIRFICCNSDFGLTEKRLTIGEKAWIWALAEFAHNIPRVGSPFGYSPPPISLSVRWVEALERLYKLYQQHRSNIIKDRAEGWTKERICSEILYGE